MSVQHKEIVRKAVTEFVKSEHSEYSEELEIVFDDVYSTIERRLVVTEPQAEAPSEGIPFDSGMIIGTIISTATWIGFSLAKAVVMYARDEGLKIALDRAEKKLISLNVDRVKVVKLREIVEGISQKL